MLMANTSEIVRKHYSKWIKGWQGALDAEVMKVNGFGELAGL